jgi:hypothetical protein
VTDEEPNRTNVICYVLGEGQSLTHSTGDMLAQCIIETLNVIRFPRFLRDGLVSIRWYHALVGFILICVECGLFTVHLWNSRSQFFGTVATAIADVKRHDLARLLIQGDLDPWLVGLLLHEAAHLIGFSLQMAQHHLARTPCGLHL